MASSTSASSSSGSSGSTSFNPGSASGRREVEKLKALQDLANNAIAVQEAQKLANDVHEGIVRIYTRILNEKFVGQLEVDQEGTANCAQLAGIEARSTYTPQFIAFETQYGVGVYELIHFAKDVNEKKKAEAKSSSISSSSSSNSSSSSTSSS